MKKTLAIFLALLLCITAMSGCGGKDDNSSESENSSSSSQKKKKKKVIVIQKEKTDDNEDNDDDDEEYDDTQDVEFVMDDTANKEIENLAQKLQIDVSAEHYAESMYVNIKSFGAAGDGKTDDTAAIQKAINTSTNKTLYFPAGTYLVSSVIYTSSHVNLLGAAAESGMGGATIIQATGDMDAIFSGMKFKTLDMYIGNITFDGGSDRGLKVGAAYAMYDARNSRVFNCAFRNVTGEGLDLDHANEGSLWVNYFNNLDFKNVQGYAIRAIVSDSFFTNITIDGGKGILDWNYSGNCFSNISVKNGSGNGLSLGREGIAEVGNTTIRNSSFVNCAGYGIWVSSPKKGSGKQATITQCYGENNRLGDINASNIAMVTIDNCTLKSAVSINAVDSTGCSFTDNRVSSSGFVGATDPEIYTENNAFNSQNASGNGYQGESSTVFPYYQKSFDIIGGTANMAYINVEDCGEPVNDDWSAVFQLAVAYAAKSGGVVYCPGEEYLIGDTVVVPSNVYILGTGIAYGKQIQPKGKIDCIFVVRKATNSGFINLSIANKNTTNKATYGGIYFMDSSDCFFYGCELTADTNGSMPYVVNMDTASQKIWAESCRGGSSAEGKAVLLLRGNDFRGQNLYMSGSPSFIISDGSGTILQSNHFEVCPTTHITIKGKTVKNVLIRSNYFDVNDCCVRMMFSEAYSSNISIVSNTFRTDAREKDQETGLNPPEIIISNGKGINVSKNTFQQGFNITTTGIACTDSIFVGNIVGNKIRRGLFAENSKALGDGCVVNNKNCD